MTQTQARHEWSDALPHHVRLRFLVVDDNPVNLKLTQKMLLQLWPQAQVTTVTGGEAALTWLAEHEADVVLLDRVMPHLDGVQTAQHIRASQKPSTREVILLGLTASDDDHDKHECVQAGMNAVASKPITAERLKAQVLDVLMQRPVRPSQLGEAP